MKKIVQDLLLEGDNVKITNRGVVDQAYLQFFIEDKYGVTIGRNKLRLMGGRYILEKSKTVKKPSYF